MPNHLAHSASPYLQQHAHQPVDWYPWGEVALAKALQEDKPILLSIGYAACHWCHVMAKTSFEDALVAALMNSHFVCIKVDREERPDVDRVYVAALQAMGLPVGWPLHAFLLPNQQPFYGGLYFAPDAWKQVLSAVAQAFRRHRPHLEATAGQLTATLQAQCSPVLPSQSVDFTHQDAQKSFQQVYVQLDLVYGGVQGAPKFPMPSVGTFLLHYHALTGDERALAQLHCTLAHMASGGLYDQLGGGFARYTTDAAWRIPHFEKMLCDNGLLLSLYAQTQAISPNACYLRVIRETVDFLTQTMLHPEGAFYSALDADSEGVEGKFYTWTLAEVEAVLGPLAPSFAAYFNITAAGNWQQGASVLYTTAGSAPTAQIEAGRQQLRQARMRRQPPARDEQIITAWNAMVLQGLVDAYWAVDERGWLDLALRNARFIEQYLLQNHRLWHSYSAGKRGLPGYLDDYAWAGRAFISLYQATLEERWLYTARGLAQYVLDHFFDACVGLCYTIEDQAPQLIARLHETWDGALPSANAVMAHNLHLLGLFFEQSTYRAVAQQMLTQMAERMRTQPLHTTHWLTLGLQQLGQVPTVAIVGPEALTWSQALRRQCPLGAVVADTIHKSDLPLLASKTALDNATTIYVCCQGRCLAPTQSLQQALQQLVAMGR